MTPTTSPPSTMRPPPQGFALIVTLIMVALAAIIVVALLTSATLDRATSKSVADRYQAEIAAKNGLEAAKKALVAVPTGATAVVGDDTFVVLRSDGTQGPNSVGNKDAYYFLAKAKPRDPAAGTSTTVDCYPLFSGGTTSMLAIDHAKYPAIPPPAAPAAKFTNPAEDAQGNPYPHLFPYQQPVFTQWQEIQDPKDTAVPPAHNLPYQRFTYWVEDLSGYLDSAAVGNTNSGGTKHTRSNGTNPNEIALFTLFNPALSSDDGSTLAKQLIDSRPLLFTAPTLSQIAAPIPPGGTDATQPNVGAAFGIDAAGERNLIPFGFGFQDEGKAKTNLNTLIASSSTADDKVTALAKVINENLPMFGTKRKGGLAATEDYVKTLSANIIDYADSDSDATVGTNYRGVDRYPFVAQFCERFIWQKHAPTDTQNFFLMNGTWYAEVKVTGYVELWNPFNKAVDSGTLTFQDINRYYAFPGGSSTANKFPDTFGKADIAFTSANALQPNEFRVFQVYEHIYDFDTGLTVYPTGGKVYVGNELGGQIDPVTCGYMCLWNGTRVDRAGAGLLDGKRGDGTDQYAGLNYIGLERNYGNLVTPGSASNPTWRATAPGLRYDALSETVWNLGDPRSSYYIARIQASNKYAKAPTSDTVEGNSAWWGRMYETGLIAGGNWVGAETLVSNWPDGDHMTIHGLLPLNTTVDPLSVAGARPAIEPDKAPLLISNSGSYTSINELGHIYDPLQWRPSAFPASGSSVPAKPSSSPDLATKWKDAWKNDLVADANYGDASTLRIGSPEFKTFDNDDTRAARLMDLFSVSDRTATRGLINLNTANREVLRAFGAGILMQRDAAIQPPSVFGPYVTAQADSFADAVLASRPFLTTSQLSGILKTPTDATSGFFGNATQWPANAPTEWNDSAREEYFARMSDLTSVRSRNFRVFVTGQSLDKNGRTVSTVNRVFQVYLSPTRDSSGVITSQQAQVTYEKDL